MARRRKRKKKLVLCVTACAVLLALLLAGGYMLLQPGEAAFSPRENRMLAEKPAFSWKSFLDGSFADGLEKYLADRFPGRIRMIDLSRELRQMGSLATWEDYARVAENDVASMEYTEDAQDSVAVTPRPTRTPTPEPTLSPTPAPAGTPSGPEDTATPEPTATLEPTATPRPTKEPVDVNDFPWELKYYLTDGTTRSYATVQRRVDIYAQCSLFDAYASTLPEGGRFVLTVAPLSNRGSRLLSYADPKGMTSEIEPFIHAVTAENVSAISAVDLLSERVLNGEYVFFHTDMHWTPYGAYLVVQRMLAEAGEELPPYEAFPKTQEYPFLGTIYRDTHYKTLKENPDTLDIVTPIRPVRVRRYSTPETYKEVPFIDVNANATDRYTVYLGGPKGNWTVIERTDIPEEEIQTTCLVITDSYGLCTMPFFAEVYDRAILYDPRYYDKSAMGAVGDLIESWGVRDIYMISGESHFYMKTFYNLGTKQF